MAEKGFGVKEIDFIGSSPKITSPNNLNLNAINVAISTNVSIGGTLSVTGGVSIGGTLTYEDVTNIDSVGIITARDGLKVLAGESSFAGITTVTGNTLFAKQVNVSGVSTFQTASAYTFTVGAGNLQVNGNSIYGSSKIMFLGGGGGDMTYYSGGTSYSDHIFKTLQGGSQIERFRIGKDGDIGLLGENYGSAGQVLTSGGAGSAVSWQTVSGGGGSGGSGFFSQTTAGIHTLSKVGIGTTNPKFDLDLGSYVSNNVSTASTIRIIGENNSTAIRIAPGGTSNDITLIRVDSKDGTTDGDNNTDLGHSIKYMGSGSGTENRLAFWVDNTNKSKYEALSIYNNGFVSINYNLGFNGVAPSDHFTIENGTSKFHAVRVVGVSTFQNVLPQTDSSYDIGSNSVRFANIYADTLYGSGANLTSLPAPDPSNSDIQGMWTVGGATSGYTFTGPGQDGSEQNPDIFLVRGQRYRFVNSLAGSHPFEFRNFDNNADYTDGITGSQSGTQDFNVQHDAPSALKYRCTIHTSSMLGNIYIVGGKRGILTSDTTLSGSSQSFDGIPSWATKIKIIFYRLSVSSNGNVYIKLRNGGGDISSGYDSYSVNDEGGTYEAQYTSGFVMKTFSNAHRHSGELIIEKIGDTRYVSTHSFLRSASAFSGAFQHLSGGGDLSISSGGIVTGIKLLSENGSFDSSPSTNYITIYYE